MFDHCRQLEISLNLKKCIFAVPFGTLLDHVVCKEGVCVDPAKFVVIVNMYPPENVKQLKSLLGHIGYYKSWRKQGFLQISTYQLRSRKKILARSPH